jgi:hypothetical protein
MCHDGWSDVLMITQWFCWLGQTVVEVKQSFAGFVACWVTKRQRTVSRLPRDVPIRALGHVVCWVLEILGRRES